MNYKTYVKLKVYNMFIINMYAVQCMLNVLVEGLLKDTIHGRLVTTTTNCTVQIGSMNWSQSCLSFIEIFLISSLGGPMCRITKHLIDWFCLLRCTTWLSTRWSRLVLSNCLQFSSQVPSGGIFFIFLIWIGASIWQNRFSMSKGSTRKT